MNYLRVDVYKNNGTDCSNDGVSKVCPALLVVPCEDGNYSEEEVENYGFTKLSLVDRGQGIRDNFIEDGETRWAMFGGTFIWRIAIIPLRYRLRCCATSSR